MHSPFRRKGVWQHLPVHSPWCVVFDAYGQPVIRDASGRDPLNGTTGAERYRNRWLAAWAPEGFEALLLMCQRLHSMQSGWARDDELVHFGITRLFGAAPFDEGRIGRAAEQQLEADFEAAEFDGRRGAHGAA